LLRVRSRFLHCVGVRDRISCTYARTELGIRVTHAVPDLALNLFSRNPQSGRRDLKRDVIGVSFRTDKNPAIEVRLKELLNGILRGTSANTQFRFIVQVERDRRFMEEICNWAVASFPG